MSLAPAPFIPCLHGTFICKPTIWERLQSKKSTQLAYLTPRQYDEVTDKDSECDQVDSKRKQIGGNHYAKHSIQPWDIIREYELDFFEGSCISYILRRKNNRLEDLQKAAHYLEECIKNEQKRMDNV